jgi:transcriptional regulator of heat shock response
MRLNYAKVIPYIEYLTERISDKISEEGGEGEDEE